MKMCAASMPSSAGAKARPALSISARTLPGIASNRARMPSFSDSFLASGVPEYPGTSSLRLD
ncbi:MAG: hypothetical protein ACJ8EB_14725 [Allosphingosinicella sp.]